MENKINIWLPIIKKYLKHQMRLLFIHSTSFYVLTLNGSRIFSHFFPITSEVPIFTLNKYDVLIDFKIDIYIVLVFHFKV